MILYAAHKGRSDYCDEIARGRSLILGRMGW